MRSTTTTPSTNGSASRIQHDAAPLTVQPARVSHSTTVRKLAEAAACIAGALTAVSVLALLGFSQPTMDAAIGVIGGVAAMCLAVRE